MNLYVLRHGLAVEPGTPGYVKDTDRPLTPEGEFSLVAIAAAMIKLEIKFDIILSSPVKRARQTAEIIAQQLNRSEKIEFAKSLEPQGSPRELINDLRQLKSAANNVLLVGHEPNLSEFISLLISGDSRSAVMMKKAGLAKLAVASLTEGRCAILQWLLTPKQLKLIGR